VARFWSFRTVALAFWLGCAFVIASGEARSSKGDRANRPAEKPFESFRLPTPKPAYPALGQ
jgi:hypothetical protein